MTSSVSGSADRTESSGLHPEAQQIAASFGRRIAALRAETEAARSALENMRATCTSADGQVTVSVDAAGALTGLDIRPGAELSAAVLAATILRTSRRARLEVLDRSRQAVIDRVGAEHRAVGVLTRRADSLRTQSDDFVAAPVPAATTPEDDPAVGFAGRGR